MIEHPFFLGIVVPARNEALRIGPLLGGIVSTMSRHPERAWRGWIVLNGCTDGTAEVVKEAVKETTGRWVVLESPQTEGKGGALRCGMTAALDAGAEWVGYLDADGSTHPSEFFRLAELAERDGWDGALGSRWGQGAQVVTPQPWMRRTLSRGFHGLVELLFRLGYRDTQCGAKVFRKEVLRPALDKDLVGGWTFDVDLLLRMRRLDARLIEVPVVWEDRVGSRVDVVWDPARMLADVFRLRVRSWINARRQKKDLRE